MMTKTIEIFEDNYRILSELASENDTFDDVIIFLISYYEEFSDNQAKCYNDEIDNFESGNLDNVTKLTLKDLEKRISKLENS
ncbi:hypothetical protein [Methanobrevibacter sp.]|uniref:hypothetical protein n=1 Tax=Methanobrevibacter sp. TaxID=66852 RepID=UPI00388DBFEE